MDMLSLIKILRPERFRVFEEYRRHLQQSKMDICEFQRNELINLLVYAVNNSHYYKNIILENGFKNNPEDPERFLELFPILTKAAINKNYSSILTVSSKRGKKITTGGATGYPTTIYKSFHEIEYQRGIWLRNHLFSGYEGEETFIWLWGADQESKVFQSVRGKLKQFISNEIYLNAFSLGPDTLMEYVHIIQNSKPCILYGYASALLQLAKYIIENKIEVVNVKKVISTAEVLRERAIIELAFRTKVFNQYGCREVLSLAQECTSGNIHISTDSAYLEFVGDGEFKKILVTAFRTLSFPLIRYEVGDFGNIKWEECNCGNPFPIMNMGIGRISDNFLLANGEIVHGEYFTHLMYDIPNIDSFQFHQKELNKVELLYVQKELLNNEEEQKFKELREKLVQKCGPIDFLIIRVDKIPPTKNGKHRFTISDIKL